MTEWSEADSSGGVTEGEPMAPLAPQSGIVHSVVFELRYNYGLTYLDRCGSVMNQMLRQHPGWTYSAVNPQSGTLQDSKTEVRFTFGSQKLDLTQEQSPTVAQLMEIVEFARLAEDMTKTTVERLDLEEFSRIGFRVWRLFEYPSISEAKKALLRANLVAAENLKQKLNLPHIDEVALTAIAHRGEAMARIAVAAVEQQIQIDPASVREAMTKARPPAEQHKALLEKLKAEKRIKQYPQHAVLIDIDNFIDDPPYPKDLKITDFVADSYNWSEETSRKLASLMQ
jgi:hypothetical protein